MSDEYELPFFPVQPEWLGAMAADIALFAALASTLISAPGTLAPVPVTAATLASLTRLTFARHAARTDRRR